MGDTACKCGATTFQGHLDRGGPGHLYTGFYWAPTDDGAVRRTEPKEESEDET